MSSADDYTYDPSGNTINDPQGRTFIYNAENKQVEVKDSLNNTIGKYWYNGDGKRVKKYVPATDETTIFVYDAMGKLIADYSTELALDKKISYTVADHLNSPRILTDENGEIISRRDFHPFGEEVTTTERIAALGYQIDDVRQKFTTYERDAETDLDFAQARMYIKNLGRFNSPDPLLSSGRINQAQSWNRYIYVLNNPYKFTDPTGFYEYADGVTDEQKKQFEQALEDARTQLDKYEKGSKEYKELERAILAYGKLGDKNGVVIAVDNTMKGGEVERKKNDATPVLVTFGAGSINSIIVAHEGVHVKDKLEWIDSEYSEDKNPSRFDTEMRAYLVTTYVAEKRAEYENFPEDVIPQFTVSHSQKTAIWQKGWDEAARRTAIEAHLGTTEYNLT